MSQQVRITWVALECLQKQEVSDEVYGTISVVADDGVPVTHAFPGDGAEYWSMGSVDKGQRIVFVQLPLYNGPPAPIGIIASLIEHDSTNVEQVKAISKTVIAKGAGALAGLLTKGFAVFAQGLLEALAEGLVKEVARLLGTADDPYDPGLLQLDERMLSNPNRQRHTRKRVDDPRTIEYTDRIVVTGRDEGRSFGEYAFYFDIRVSAPAPAPRPHSAVVPGPAWFQQNVEKIGTTFLVSTTSSVGWGTKWVDVFHGAAGDPNAIGQTYSRGGRFVTGKLAEGREVTGISVTKRGSNRIDVFYNSGRRLWHRAWDGANWLKSVDLGGKLRPGHGTAAVSWGSDRLDVFYQGPQNELMQRAWGGGAWSGEYALGGQLAGRPAAASRGHNRLDVFYRTPGNRLGHTWWDGQRWQHADLGGTVDGDPAAASWGPNRVDVFYRAPGNRVHQRVCENGAWSAAYDLGLGRGQVHGLSAATWGRGRMDLFYTELSGAVTSLWHHWVS